MKVSSVADAPGRPQVADQSAWCQEAVQQHWSSVLRRTAYPGHAEPVPTVAAGYSPSPFQNEGYLHSHPVLINLAVFHARLLLDHVQTSDPTQCPVCAFKAPWTAASKLVGEAAVIFDTLATAIFASLMELAA